MSINTQVERIQIGEAFGYGWRKLMENAWPWIFVTLTLMATGFVFGWLADLTTNEPLGFLLQLASFVLPTAIAYAMVVMALDTVQGNQVKIPGLGARINAVVTFVVATFLFGLGVAFGLVLLIVPGVIFALAYFLYGFVIADEVTDPITAMKRSADLTRGHRGRLFKGGVVAFLVILLGLLAFGVGILLSYPVTIIAEGHIYRQLTGDPIIE